MKRGIENIKVSSFWGVYDEESRDPSTSFVHFIHSFRSGWRVVYVFWVPSTDFTILSIFMINRREQGREGEETALQWYLDRGWTLVAQNYTIRWGELDLIVENDEKLVFVEVKIINRIEDMHDYITRGKMGHIKRTLQRYLIDFPSDKEIQIDVVFIQQGEILEVFKNVTMK